MQDRNPANRPSIAILTALEASIQARRAALSNEILMRGSILAALVSATVIGLSFLAQATQFSRDTALLALVLLPVTLFVGLTTFLRAIDVNREDAAAEQGLARVHDAYVRAQPSIAVVLRGEPSAATGALGQGLPQRPAHLARSLTTTSSVIAALNSVLAGALVSVGAAAVGLPMNAAVVIGAVIALVAAVAHVAFAARMREARLPAINEQAEGPSPARARRGPGSRSRRPRESKA